MEHERYGQIYLTEAGKNRAMKVYEKHRLITEYLVKALDVSLPVAEKDACSIEHIISEETFKKMKAYLKQ